MLKQKLIYPGIVTIVIIFLSACATGDKNLAKKQYNIGTQLTQAQKYEEAIDYFKQAIENEPTNREYQAKYQETKEFIIEQYTQKGTKALNKSAKTNIMDISNAKGFLKKASFIDASHQKTIQLKNKIEQQEADFIGEMKTYYANAKQFYQAKEWLKSYFNLNQLQNRFPNYEDSPQLLSLVLNEGSKTFYDTAVLQMESDDIKGAIDNLRSALALQVDFREARDLMATARSRDNKEYFINKAKLAVKKRNWDAAIQLYQGALTYSPGDKGIIETIAKVREGAINYYIQKVREKLELGRIYLAYENFNSANKYSGKKFNMSLTNLRQNLCKRANYAAEGFKEDGFWGCAWYWYKKIESINPNYPKIFHLIQEMEDEVNQRVRKSIAIFDFSSPTGNDDAGVIIANNLITFLFKTASGDIQILERENLKSILEEMKLGQIGVVSPNSAKEMGRVYGIDVAIMGSVLLFKVDSTSTKGTKTIKYQAGTLIQDNIEYLNWLAKHPKPKRKELQNAPSAKIMTPQYIEKEYMVSRQKKIAFVQLSFRIVDITTGENIQVKTIERKQSIEDDGSAGLTEANIEFDPIEIPSDTEMLQEITEEVVAELGREALRPMQNLEKSYFQDGEKFLRRKEPTLAAENFVNALFDERLKRINDSLLSNQSKLHLDKIFLDFEQKFEG